MPLRALTLDLDDTLWPVWPAIRRADAGMQAWLADRAPATWALHGAEGLRRSRQTVLAERPELANDLSALRRESIRSALQAAGDNPALAEPAFDVFFALRQQVGLYDDVVPALDRLAGRYRLVALSNGNADLQHIPAIAGFFSGALSAQGLGVRKPAPQAFAAACALAGCTAAEVLHVGDDGHTDVDGALDAGLQAAWVCRADLPPPTPPTRLPTYQVARLDELVNLLGL